MSTLAGITVVVTRPLKQSQEIIEALSNYGAEVVVAPVLETVATNLNSAEIEQLNRLSAGSYHCLVISSANGARYLAQHLGNRKISVQTKIAAQGMATANAVAQALGRKADFVPKISVAEGFAQELIATGIKGQQVLLAAANKTRGVISDLLSSAGATVDVLSVYQTRTLPISETNLLAIKSAKHLVFTFYSPSAVDAAVESLKSVKLDSVLDRAAIISIGEVTSRAVVGAGLQVAGEAIEQSDQGILSALLALRVLIQPPY